MKHKKEIYEKMKRRDFGESMCDETKLKVLNFVERQLRLYNVSNCAIKPPLGLVPKWVRQKERHEEVCQAIARYYNDNREIPTEWVEEYNELVKHCC